MKVFAFSIIAVVIMGMLFVTGLLGSNPGPLLAGFCGWTPAVFLLGWSIRSLLIGKRIVLQNTDAVGQRLSVNHRPRQPERVSNLTRKGNL
jgi:hypothetical protein